MASGSRWDKKIQQQSDEKTFQWEKLPKKDCPPWKGASVTLCPEFIIFFGGWHDADFTNELFLFNLKENKWSKGEIESATPIQPRAFHTTTFFQGHLIVSYGGINRERKVLEHFEILEGRPQSDLFGNTKIVWSFREMPVSLPRYGHSCFSYTHFLLSFGGLDENHQPTNELVFCPSGNWEKCKTSGEPPKERAFHCSVLIKDTLYIYGGNSLAQSAQTPLEELSLHNLSDIHLLSLGNMTWHKLEAPPFEFQRKSFATVNYENFIFLFGGSKSEEENEFWAYDTEKNKWLSVATSGQGPKFIESPCAVSYNNIMLLCNKGGKEFNEQEGLFTITLDTEIPISTSKERKCKGEAAGYFAHFKTLFEERLFSDITFEVENKEIHANKAILSSRSGYFKRMFSSGMVEAQSSRIPIPNMKYVIFNAILEYIYCNEVTLDENLAVEILPIIDEYLMNSLKDLCQKFLSQNLKKQNVIDLLILSDTYDAQILRSACLKFIVNNLNEFYGTEEMMKIPQLLLVELLAFSTWGPEGKKNNDEYTSKERKSKKNEDSEEAKKLTTKNYKIAEPKQGYNSSFFPTEKKGSSMRKY